MNSKCTNTLDIYGLNAELINFFNNNRVKPIKSKKLLNQNILTFQKAIEVDPSDYKKTKELWGTKFDAEIIDWEEDLENENLEQMYYKFKTFRNPPFKWLEFVAKKYAELEFRLNYENEDDGYIGEICYSGGELCNSMLMKYEEQAWNLLKDDLVNEIGLYYKKEGKSQIIIEQLKDKKGNHYQKIKKIIEDYDNLAKYIIHRVMDEFISNQI
jgi:gas vesicle protein